MYEITVRYKCAGCGLRWSKVFWGDKVMDRVIVVPESKSPCCGDERDAYVTTIDDLRSMPRS